jgi:hypothetical protein
MTRVAVAAAVLSAAVGIAATAPASAEPEPVTAAGAKAIRKATKRLGNKQFTRFTESGMSSFDQRLHLCRDKRFIYDTVSSSGDVRRVEGRWRVVSARIRGSAWRARVRGTPSGGSGPIAVLIRTNGRRTTIDGNLVFAERSDLC